MAKVTIESLSQRIAELDSRPRSLNEDFQLEAYRELQRYKAWHQTLPYVIHELEDE